MELSNLLFYFSMINMLCTEKKQSYEQKPEWHFPLGGGEMPEECMLREVKEETGLTLTSYRPRGVITFISNEWGTEYMHLFTADQFTGEMTDCDEGELVWVSKKEIKDLKLWEGDKIFLRLLDECEEYFSLKLVYEGDTLVDKKLIIAGKEQKAE